MADKITMYSDLYEVRLQWFVQSALVDKHSYCFGAIAALIVAFAFAPWSMFWAFVFLAIGCRHAMFAKRVAFHQEER